MDFDGKNQQILCPDKEMDGSPFLYEQCLYFRTSDSKLWRVNYHGEVLAPISCTIHSSPVVRDDFIYFEGDDQELRCVNIHDTEGWGFGSQIDGSPFVADSMIYFKGINDGNLWRQPISDRTGAERIQLGDSRTASSPFVSDGWVYFRGIDNALWCIRTDGSERHQYANALTICTPVVDGKRLYYKDGFSRIRCIEDHRIFDSAPMQVGNYVAKSKLFARDNQLYFQGTDDRLWMMIPELTKYDVCGAVEVTNRGGFVMRFAIATPDHGVYQPTSVPDLAIGQSHVWNLTGPVQEGEICPIANIEAGKQGHYAEQNVILDRKSNAVACYEIRGTTFTPYFNYLGLK